MLRRPLPLSVVSRRAFQPMGGGCTPLSNTPLLNAYVTPTCFSFREQATSSTAARPAISSPTVSSAVKTPARQSRKRQPPRASSLPFSSAAMPTTAVANSSRLQFDASKAGMQSVDKQHVQRVIENLSKGSKFYVHEQQRGAQRVLQNKALVVRANAYLQHGMPTVRAANLRTANQYVKELEATRDLSRTFMHIDMDAFYAAVAELYDPSLKDIPFAVGAMAMLSTTNYAARQFGVRSGMPGFIAKRLCPQLKLVPVDFPAYEAAAAKVRAIAARYDPCYVTLGLDDLTMEITGYLQARPSMTAAEVCQQFRREVFEVTQLTCSGGIAPTPAFAKLESNKQKPKGQSEAQLRTREEVLQYVRDIPMRQCFGVGPAQEGTLHALGIHTCKDVLERRELLVYLFTEKRARFYLSLGLGTARTHVERVLDEDKQAATKNSAVSPFTATGSSASVSVSEDDVIGEQASTKLADTPTTGKHEADTVAVHRQRKSISKCATLFKRLRAAEALHTKMEELFTKAYGTLTTEALVAQTVWLQFTSNDFVARSVQRTMATATDEKDVLFSALEELLAGTHIVTKTEEGGPESNKNSSSEEERKAPQAIPVSTIRCFGVGFTKLSPLSEKGAAASPAASPPSSVAAAGTKIKPVSRGKAANRSATAKIRKSNPRKKQH